MSWSIRTTQPFDNTTRKHKKNQELLRALGKKIERLRRDPHSVGGSLSGRLHGMKATRLVGKFRLVFRIIDQTQTVWLSAIDHRKSDYAQF